EQTLGQILGGSEFYARAQTLVNTGSADERYVRALYQVLLNRTSDGVEGAGWLSVMPGVGRAGVAQAFLKGPEFRLNQVEAYYMTLLHRPADAANRNGWASSALDLTALRIAIESGPEFFAIG